MNFFQGIFDTTSTAINVSGFLICLLVSLLIGCFLSMVYVYKNKPSKSFLLTLGLLPAIVCVVIMMVNGNIGAGVAVAGAFSLVRFRSAPGTAREIVAIFLAMGTGLICGMGYLGYAVLFAGILGIIILVFNLSCDSILGSEEKLLRITVPEDLDYAHEFDDVLSQYTENYHLNAVKTTNMGSLQAYLFRDPEE